MEAAFHNAVLSLFRGVSVAEANQFLSEFVSYKESWHIALNALSSEVEFLQFFSANILYSNARKQSGTLSETDRSEILSALFERLVVLAKSGVSRNQKAIYSRISLAFVCLCCTRSVVGLEDFFVVTSQLQASGNANLFVLMLELWSLLPQELDAFGSSKFEVVDQWMALKAEAIFSLLESAVSTSVPIDDTVARLCLEVYRAWIRYFPSSMHFTFNERYYEFVRNCLVSETETVFVESHRLIVAAISLKQYPESAERKAALLGLFSYISSSLTKLLNVLNVLTPDGRCEVVSSIAEVVSLEWELLASSNHFNPVLIQFLLTLTASRPRSLSSCMLDMWAALQDVEPEQRHDFLRKDVYRNLLGVLFDQCIWSCHRSSAAELTDQELEDFECFRSTTCGGAEDLIRSCFDELGPLYFALLQDRLSALEMPVTETNWQVLEVVGFLIVSAGSSIKISATDAQSQQFLGSLLHLSLATSRANKQLLDLQRIVVLLVQSLTSFLTKQPAWISLFWESISFLCESLLNLALSKLVSECFLKITVHGKLLLIEDQCQGNHFLSWLLDWTRRFLLMNANTLPSEILPPISSWLESVVRIVVELPKELFPQLLSALIMEYLSDVAIRLPSLSLPLVRMHLSLIGAFNKPLRDISFDFPVGSDYEILFKAQWKLFDAVVSLPNLQIREMSLHLLSSLLAADHSSTFENVGHMTYLCTFLSSSLHSMISPPLFSCVDSLLQIEAKNGRESDAMNELIVNCLRSSSNFQNHGDVSYLVGFTDVIGSMWSYRSRYLLKQEFLPPTWEFLLTLLASVGEVKTFRSVHNVVRILLSVEGMESARGFYILKCIEVLLSKLDEVPSVLFSYYTTMLMELLSLSQSLDSASETMNCTVSALLQVDRFAGLTNRNMLVRLGEELQTRSSHKQRFKLLVELLHKFSVGLLTEDSFAEFV